jgi:hypothetical protein
MIAGNAVSHCNGSSALSSWEAVISIKVLIWNKEHLMGAEPHLYIYEGRSESNASYFIILGHDVRCRCWWYGSRG